MEPADSIRRLGFARWYERRLIEAHAWFVSGFFCMIAIAARIAKYDATTEKIAITITPA